MRRLRVAGVAWALLFTAVALAQQGDGTDVSVIANVWKQRQAPADDARIARLRVAPGFAVNVFARNLGNARIVTLAPSGNVCFTRCDEGDVMLLRDANEDGQAEQPRLTDPEGVLQGRTSRGTFGYFGPRPALDKMPAVPFGAERDELLAAMQGHVLAAGELIGTYQQMVAPLKSGV